MTFPFGPPMLIGRSIGNEWNPADKGAGVVLTDANLTGTIDGATMYSVRARKALASGKACFEVLVTNDSGIGNDAYFGIGTASMALDNFIGADAAGWSYRDTGQISNNGGDTGLEDYDPYETGDVLTAYLDRTNNKLWFAKNGVVQGSGSPNPLTNTAGISIAASTWFPACGGRSGASYTLRDPRYTLSGFPPLRLP